MTTKLPVIGDVIPVNIFIYDSRKNLDLTVEHQMTVTKIFFWADNSIDVVGVFEDGTKHKQQWEAPHGDLCY